MTLARAFWLAEPGLAELREEQLPLPGPDDVLVETLWSGVSRGTETLVFRGLVPPSLAQAMRCPFQEGAFPAPVKYGYQNVGRLEDGQRVFCLFPHQDRYVVPRAAVLALPDDLPARRAVLAANMETAINALWDAPARPGARVAVIGAGVVGCLVAALAARVPGAEVTLIDTLPARASLASALGCSFAAPGQAPGGADIVFHASGRAEGLELALGLAGLEAEVVELSWYGDTPVAAPLGRWFHPGRLTLRSSQVGQVAPAQRPRWSHRDRLALALRLLCDPVYDALIDGEIAFADLPVAMAALAEQGPGPLCRAVRYPVQESLRIEEV
jgi:threonine dehydrogenase-like Zn-dependent dehydrogenase